MSYTQSYREGRGKHAVQEEYLKQVEVLIKNDVDFLIGEVGVHQWSRVHPDVSNMMMYRKKMKLIPCECWCAL